MRGSAPSAGQKTTPSECDASDGLKESMTSREHSPVEHPAAMGSSVAAPAGVL